MPDTTHHLKNMADHIRVYGLHRGDQFAHLGPVITLDISALAYVIAEDSFPDEFFTDEITSMAIIEASAPAMACLRAISDALDSAVNDTQIAPGMWVPDYVEHVSTWAMTPGIGQTEPPTNDEVVARIELATRYAPTPTT